MYHLDLINKLRVEADKVAADISGDNPSVDVSYDLWVEEEFSFSEDQTKLTIGVIDMGDSFQAVYRWCEDRWERVDGWSTYEIINQLVEMRSMPDG